MNDHYCDQISLITRLIYLSFFSGAFFILLHNQNSFVKSQEKQRVLPLFSLNIRNNVFELKQIVILMSCKYSC